MKAILSGLHALSLAHTRGPKEHGVAGDALLTGRWQQVAERHFQTLAIFTDFNHFEQRLMRPTFADHCIDDAMLAAVQTSFEPHLDTGGA